VVSAPAAVRSVVIAGIGEYPLRSFELTGMNRLAARFEPGADTARLFLTLTRGDTIENVTVTTGSRIVALTYARVTDFRQTGALVTVEFTGATMEVI
jgi:hypothetical protein